MNFAWLEQNCEHWRDIRVIGRTIEREGDLYHLIGMTLAEEAKLYALAPYREPERPRRRERTQRQLQRSGGGWDTYLSLEEVRIGSRRLPVGSISGDPLKYAARPDGKSQLFFDMLRAGWTVPGWLKEVDWEHLELETLELPGVKRLPPCTPDTPITLRHGGKSVRHLLEKPVTLTVGGSRTVSFTDHRGETVQCHIDRVLLVDVWGEMEGMLNDPRRWEGLPPEEEARVRAGFLQSLEQSCPRGMCYVGVEYECGREDVSVQFYTRQFLCSQPQSGGAGILLFRTRKGRETGPHGLPLRRDTLGSAVPPDTKKVPAELFAYYERTAPWEEQV